MPAKLTTLLIGCALLAGCYSNPYYNPARHHHTPQGFSNNYTDELALRGNFLKWRWQRLWQDVPPSDTVPETVKPDTAFLKNNRSQNTLTWIGHSTLLLQLNGVNILTDPVFSQRASPFSFIGPKRRVPVPMTIAELPHIDIVVISHDHYDHLDADSVDVLNAQAGGPPRFFVPLGLKPWFAARGILAVEEMDWWEHQDYKGLTVHFTPAQHWSARRLFQRNRTLWGSWTIVAPRFRFFFAGDTGYSPDFQDIGKKLGPFDLAALPIGAYEPRWFMHAQHINPGEAVKISQDLHARHAVAIHWGTFPLSDEALDQPPRDLAQARANAGVEAERFFLIKHGETRTLDLLKP
ncbi:MAG: MBL fold metallo-hydrolase [Burkholderiales bacterium]